MKKRYLILAAFCLAFSITACSSKQPESTSSQETETVKQETTTKAEETKRPSEQESESKTETAAETETEKKEEKKAVTGRVDEIDKTVITISGQDGLTYQVDIKGAETRSDLEIGEGDEIQAVFVDGEEEVKQAESYTVISSVSLEGDMDPVIVGVIKEAGADTITVEPEEAVGGKGYTFSTTIAQIVTGDKGLAVGEYVEITYLENVSKGIALRVITEEASGDIEATYKILQGTLTSYTETAAVITAADGSQFTFALSEYVDVSELVVGETVEITYEGSLTQKNAIAVDVE